MAVKQLEFEADARAALLAGVEKLAAAVKSTLGPRGRNAVIDKSWGGPTVTKDGVTVAEEIELIDKNENLGAKLLKEAASNTAIARSIPSCLAAFTLLHQRILYFPHSIYKNGIMPGLRGFFFDHNTSQM